MGNIERFDDVKEIQKLSGLGLVACSSGKHKGMSEKDLRIRKNREEMAGGFSNEKGRQMYCDIISFIETVKRKKKNIFQSIIALMKGTPVIE